LKLGVAVARVVAQLATQPKAVVVLVGSMQKKLLPSYQVLVIQLWLALVVRVVQVMVLKA
jgi:hypothetical protein